MSGVIVSFKGSETVVVSSSEDGDDRSNFEINVSGELKVVAWSAKTRELDGTFDQIYTRIQLQIGDYIYEDIEGDGTMDGFVQAKFWGSRLIVERLSSTAS